MSARERRTLAIEREGRFDAVRGELEERLLRSKALNPWLGAPGVVGCHCGRECELRWPGGPHAAQVEVRARVRMGQRFDAWARNRFLRWLGWPYLVLKGGAPEGVPFATERLLKDFDALRVWCSRGQVCLRARWDPDEPDLERLLSILDRLHRIALALEEVREPPAEDGGQLVCPFCHTAIEPDKPLARCEGCFTPHHPSCFEENVGCAVYGCDHLSAMTRSGRQVRQKDGDAGAAS